MTDEGYIPCVSMQDFQRKEDVLDRNVYCIALDFGCKAYVNLLVIWTIQQELSQKLHLQNDTMTIIVKSAHYIKDEEKVLNILRDTKNSSI